MKETMLVILDETAKAVWVCPVTLRPRTVKSGAISSCGTRAHKQMSRYDLHPVCQAAQASADAGHLKPIRVEYGADQRVAIVHSVGEKEPPIRCKRKSSAKVFHPALDAESLAPLGGGGSGSGRLRCADGTLVSRYPMGRITIGALPKQQSITGSRAPWRAVSVLNIS
eukprot:COSAG01_NODE_5670_length_4108_cov_15.236219_3_plen_168_part_00